MAIQNIDPCMKENYILLQIYSYNEEKIAYFWSGPRISVPRGKTAPPPDFGPCMTVVNNAYLSIQCYLLKEEGRRIGVDLRAIETGGLSIGKRLVRPDLKAGEPCGRPGCVLDLCSGGAGGPHNVPNLESDQPRLEQQPGSPDAAGQRGPGGAGQGARPPGPQDRGDREGAAI